VESHLGHFCNGSCKGMLAILALSAIEPGLIEPPWGCDGVRFDGGGCDGVVKRGVLTIVFAPWWFGCCKKGNKIISWRYKNQIFGIFKRRV
jgi:hypothetical protein